MITVNHNMQTIITIIITSDWKNFWPNFDTTICRLELYQNIVSKCQKSCRVSSQSNPDCKISHRLFERFMFLGITDAQLRIPLKPLNVIILWWSKGFQGGPPTGPLWSRETSVSRTAMRLIAVVFSLWMDTN